MLHLMTNWSAAHPDQTAINVNYQPVGSGLGVEKLMQHKLDFATSDVPIPLEVLSQNQLMQFPLIGSGVVVVVHIDGLHTEQLKIGRKELAEIFLGKITNWNDPGITDDNPGLTLPNKQITVVHRGDPSGSTYAFTSYLSKIRPEWSREVGAGFTVPWKVGIDATANKGVADMVARTPNSIGYLSYDYAMHNKLSCVQLLNKDNHFVSPNKDSLIEGLSHMNWDFGNKFSAIQVNPAGKGSWPISTALFVILPTQQDNAGAKKALFDYFNWFIDEKVQASDTLSYVPLPEIMRGYVKTLLRTELGEHGLLK